MTIVGLGEDGPNGLSPASHDALARADCVMGATRHLSLLPDLTCETVEWPVPYLDGIPLLLAQRGRRVVVLASGDPFWFGAGSVICKHLKPGEWQAISGPSTFSLAASHMGWPLEQTTCLGLHAAPFGRLRPHLGTGNRAIVLLRDGDAVANLASWLCDKGFGQSQMSVMEALGGSRERIRTAVADAFAFKDIAHPVCVALAMIGPGFVQAAGRPDALFDHDGQITKRPIRALTLSALAPRPGELLWDIGSGSGSIAIEWLLSHPSTSAIAIEADPARAARITQNAVSLGVDRLKITQGMAPNALINLDKPDVVFVGGGLSSDLLNTLWDRLPAGTRLVANAVTLESEATLTQWHSQKGGTLMRIELAQAKPLGRKHGWASSYPIVQWSVTL